MIRHVTSSHTLVFLCSNVVYTTSQSLNFCTQISIQQLARSVLSFAQNVVCHSGTDFEASRPTEIEVFFASFQGGRRRDSVYYLVKLNTFPLYPAVMRKTDDFHALPVATVSLINSTTAVVSAPHCPQPSTTTFTALPQIFPSRPPTPLLQHD